LILAVCAILAAAPASGYAAVLHRHDVAQSRSRTVDSALFSKFEVRSSKFEAQAAPFSSLPH
jgi:hypothetical protein